MKQRERKPSAGMLFFQAAAPAHPAQFMGLLRHLLINMAFFRKALKNKGP